MTLKKYALEYSGYGFNYFFNLGDEIQTLAAVRLMGEVDGYISRESLNEADFSGIVSLNGFFMGSNNWPPHESITPVFYSFHLHKQYEKIICSPEGIKYLKKHQPIGCRDVGTMDILKKYDVDAYYSGCLTLTLPVRQIDSHEPKDIFLVGVDKRIETVIPNEILKKSIRINQSDLRLPKISCDVKRKIAQDLLDGYAKNAKLVITSKIHCAMPCLAMGIPVIFLYPKDKINDYRVHLIKDFIPIHYVSRSFLIRKLGLQKIKSNEINWNPSRVDLENRKKEIINGYLNAIQLAGNRAQSSGFNMEKRL